DDAGLSGDGAYKICVRLADTAGNLTYGDGPSLTLDTTPPVFTSLALANAATDTYISAAEHAASTALAGSLVSSGSASAAYALAASGTTCNGGLSYGGMPASDDGGLSVDGAYKVCVKLLDT